jgi:hypothetical protein
MEGRIAEADPRHASEALARKWHQKFRTEFPLCCFASNREHILMWSYYAGGHSGVAIHFDATLVPFGASSKVTYSTSYPGIPVPYPDGMTAHDVMTESLLTKSDHWSHEGEYRFINYPTDADNPTAARVLSNVFRWSSDQICNMPPQMLNGITLGAAMTPNFRTSLQQICAAREPPLPVWQAECDSTSYKVTLARLA